MWVIRVLDVESGTRPKLIEAARRRYRLTSRQVDVLESLIRGMANKEIAPSTGSTGSSRTRWSWLFCAAARIRHDDDAP